MEGLKLGQVRRGDVGIGVKRIQLLLVALGMIKGVSFVPVLEAHVRIRKQ